MYNSEEYKYDKTGNMTASIVYDGQNPASVTQYQYDLSGRTTKMITGLTAYSENPAGGHVTSYEYNSRGYLSRETDPMGNDDEYGEYDRQGNLLQKATKRGDVIVYEYGPYGLTRVSEPLYDTITTEYNSLGQVVGTVSQRRDEPEVRESYTYDAFGRLISSSAADGTAQTYTYDKNSNISAYTLTKDGEVKNSVLYEHNSLNQLTKLTGNDNILSYNYDANGNLTKVKNGASDNISIEYNAANLPSRYVSNFGGKSADYRMEYRANGEKYQEEDVRNNIIWSYQYTPLGQLKSEYADNGTHVLYKFNYEYDASGNRTKMEQRDYASSTKNIVNYEYNANNQLTVKTSIDGVSYTASTGDVSSVTRYYYDRAGNTTAEQKTVYGSGGKASSSMGVSGYSDKGYMKLYKYDAFNRQIQYNDGETEAKYRYNAANLRTSKKVNGTKTTFVWDGQNLAAETTNGVTTAYTYDVTGIVMSKSGNDSVTRYIKDPHGNVVATAKGNNVMNEYLYSAFGNQMESTITLLDPFRYCGEYLDSESGLIYLRNRYYDSDTGRFISEDQNWNIDNMIYGDSESNLPDIAAIMQSGNLYVYGRNNPVIFIDPSGREAYTHYSDLDSLVKDWAWNYYSTSYYIRREMGSLIYSKYDENGKLYYAYTWAKVGEPHRVAVEETRINSPGDGRLVGAIHSHPNYIGGFSDNDRGLYSPKNSLTDYPLIPYLVDGTPDNYRIIKYSDNRYEGKPTTQLVMENQYSMPLSSARRADLKNRFQKDWNKHIRGDINCTCANDTSFPHTW